MWSKTWAIALAIISRLTVTDCLGPPPPPPPHRPYQSASSEQQQHQQQQQRVRDPDREIDAAYRMMEELARRDTLRRHNMLPPAQNGGNSVAEVDYVDDATEQQRHRYLGNKHQPRLRFATGEEPPPDTTRTGHHRQGFLRTSFAGPRTGQTHVGGDQHKPQRQHGEGTRDDDPEDPAAAPPRFGVRTRSGPESFQPIAAAVAMHENLNGLHQEPIPPPPPPTPKHHQISSGDIQPEPGRHPPPPSQEVNGPIGFGAGDDENKEILRPDSSTDGDEGRVAENGIRMMALQNNPETGPSSETGSLTEVYLLAVIAGCSVAGFVGLLVAGVCYYRLKKKVKATSDVDYPAYGVTGPNKERDGGGGGGGGGGVTGDRKLAQSAQMYHYQHQKQQMIASERLNSDANHHRVGSDAESDDENEEGDYTVFECPGLATNGDMEVRNPLFNEQTPVTAPLDAAGAHSKK